MVACALAVCANASVDFFFTSSLDPYGLNDPSLAFLHSKGNGTDYMDGYKLTAAGAPPLGAMADVVIDDPQTQWAYIWGRFVNQAGNPTINGISITVNGALPGAGNIVSYKLDNLQDFEIERVRWDGDPTVFYFNPPAMVAVTANGIRNLPGNLPWNLYIGGDYRTFLLGAVKLPTGVQELTMSFGPTPVNFKEHPTIPNPPATALNKVIIPEPAGLLLLGLAGLVLRRR